MCLLLASYRILSDIMAEGEALALLKVATIEPSRKVIHESTKRILDDASDPMAGLVDASKQRESGFFGQSFTFERHQDDQQAYILHVKRCFYHDLWWQTSLLNSCRSCVSGIGCGRVLSNLLNMGSHLNYQQLSVIVVICVDFAFDDSPSKARWVTQEIVSMQPITITPEGIQFQRYPFKPASVFPDGLLPWHNIREIIPTGAPPEIRTHQGEVLFVHESGGSEFQRGILGSYRHCRSWFANCGVSRNGCKI